MDTILLLVGALLIIVLVAFFAGWIPYPVGWIALSALFIYRIVSLRRKHGNKSGLFK